MIKAVREQFWYVRSFVRKYSAQVIMGMAATILLALAGNFIFSKLPKPKPTYRVGLIGQYTTSQLPQTILNLINGGLTTFNDQMEVIPNLAEKWTVDPQNNTYTFQLKQDLKWSDGTPVELKDIKMSIPGVSVEMAEPRSINFKLPSKFSPFPSLLNFPLISAKGRVIGDYDIKIKQKSSGVVTQITLESVQKKIVFNFYSTAKQAITAYKLGQIDLVAEIPSSQDGSLASFGKINKSIDFSQLVMVIFNQTDPSLKDKNTRQGIAYALKDKSFGETPALTTINPRSWSYNPLVKTYQYNLQRTKELIKSPVTLELSTLPELLPVAEKIKSELESDLIKINVKVVTSTPEQFQMFLTTFHIPMDPDQYQNWHSTQANNIGKSNDEKIDKLLEDGRTIFDQKERKLIYLDFQKTFSEELPALVLYHPSYFNLARKEAYFDIINTKKSE